MNLPKGKSSAREKIVLGTNSQARFGLKWEIVEFVLFCVLIRTWDQSCVRRATDLHSVGQQKTFYYPLFFWRWATQCIINLHCKPTAPNFRHSQACKVKILSDSLLFCQVEDRFSASYTAGQSLLTKINNTVSSMDEGLNCFDNAKSDAQNASNTAQLAFNVSENAKQVSSSLEIVVYICHSRHLYLFKLFVV